MKTRVTTEIGLALSLTLLIGSCAHWIDYRWGDFDNSGTVLSVGELVAVGERYDGWDVTTGGILGVSGESAYLFSNGDAYAVFDGSAAIFVVVDADQLMSKLGVEDLALLDGRYVEVQGRFINVPREQVVPDVIRTGIQKGGVLEKVTYIATMD